MKKKVFSLILALVMVLLLLPAAQAASAEQQNAADALNYLQMFLGTDKGYALDNNLTREQGVMLLLRMLGKLSEAESSTAKHPFKDIKVSYYDKYIAYAYSTKLTAGTGNTTFGFGGTMTEQMFLTFCLRSLGYNDAEKANYVWENAYTLAYANRLIGAQTVNERFTRGAAVEVFWNALNAELTDGSKTLAEKLIAEGVFTEEAFVKATAIEACGKENAAMLNCSHLKTGSKVTKKATCETEGERVYCCSACGLVIQTKKIPALGHSYHYESDASQHWRVCETCGIKQEAKDHSFNASGVCAVCGYGCTHSFKTEVTAPSCTKCGYTTHTCSLCGYSYQDSIVPATEHSYTGSVKKEATCTEKGVTLYTCSKCGDHYEKTDIPVRDHNYVGSITTPATQWNSGVKTFTCTYCKASYTEAIPAIGGKEASAVTWEEYQKMTGVEKDEFFASFSSSSAFVEWKKKAQADYQAGQTGIQTIGSGGTINLQ